MTLKELRSRLQKIRYWPQIFAGEKDYLFIMSHMRSRSSLLSHILGSHPDVTGYAEISQSYHTLKDLKELRYRVWELNDRSLEGRYVLDKLLHNRYSVTDSILTTSSVRLCFLLRQPEDAIRSIMMLAKLHSGASLWEDASAAASYYEDRISQLAQYAEKCSRPGFFVESDELIDNTGAVLSAMSRWLDLKEPLTSRYSLFEKTGKPGFGDPSEVILSGKVVSNKSRYQDIHLSQDILAKPREVYELAKSVFAKKCVHL